MLEIIEAMKTMTLEIPKGEGYSPATLAAMREDDEHDYKENHSKS